jgi:hypothetical protein
MAEIKMEEKPQEAKVEATGTKRVTEKRETLLKAIGKIVESLFPEEELYIIYINENREHPERVYSVNFVFHKNGKNVQP